jgi:hypothetical protein
MLLKAMDITVLMIVLKKASEKSGAFVLVVRTVLESVSVVADISPTNC